MLFRSADLTTLGNGSISVSARATDLAGNTSNAGTTSFTLDTTSPTVTSVAITSATGIQSSTLRAGAVVSVTVTMSEAVTVSAVNGKPQLTLNIGGTLVQANYASGTGTSLVFTYTILAGQHDTNGISIEANSLTLNGGTIADAAGNAAILAHAAVADNASYLVDTVPVVTAVTLPASGTYAVGSKITVRVKFSEAVVLGGTSTTNPSLSLKLSSTVTRNAVYESGSGTDELVFSYTVVSGDSSAGITFPTSITLPTGRTLRDATGNNAVLTWTLPAPLPSVRI